MIIGLRQRLLGLADGQIIADPGGVALLGFAQRLVGQVHARARHFHLPLRRRDVEQCVPHVGVHLRIHIAQLRALGVQLRLRLFRLAAQTILLEQRRAHCAAGVDRAVRMAHIHADVAIIHVGLERGIAVGRRRLALLFGGFGLLHHRRQVLAVGMSLLQHRIQIDLVESRIGRLIHQVEFLRQRQPDGARQGQPIFFQRILRHDKLLLQRLVIDPRSKFIEQRSGARLVAVHGLVERNLGRTHLRLCAGYAGLVRQHHEIGVAHRQHHHVARVLRRKLRGIEVVFRGQVVAQRIHVDQRPAQRSPNVGKSERPHNGRKMRKPQPLCRKVHLQFGFLDVAFHRRQ